MQYLEILIKVDNIHIGYNHWRCGTDDRATQIIIYRQPLIGTCQ